MVAEKVDNPHRFGLQYDIRTDALAYQFKRSGELYSTFLAMTPRNTVIDASGQTMQFSVGECGRFADVVAAATKASVVLGEKLQERY